MRFYQQSLSLSLSVGSKSEAKRVCKPKQPQRVSTKIWSSFVAFRSAPGQPQHHLRSVTAIALSCKIILVTASWLAAALQGIMQIHAHVLFRGSSTLVHTCAHLDQDTSECRVVFVEFMCSLLSSFDVCDSCATRPLSLPYTLSDEHTRNKRYRNDN